MWFRSLRILSGVMMAATLFSRDCIGQDFDVRVTAPASVNVGSTIAYTIIVSNRTANPFSGVSVNNSFPTSLQFVSASPTPSATNSGMVTFVIDLQPNAGLQLNLTLRTTQAETVVNTVTVSGGGGSPASASATTSVNAVSGQSDLSVSVPARPPGDVFVDDWVPFSITVANNGMTVSGVFLTNTWLGSAIVRGHRPSSGVTISNGRVIFNLGTLEGNQSTNVQLVLQPTAGTNFTLIARVNSAGIADTNLVNNSRSNSVLLLTPVLGQLEADFNSPQVFNAQNALMEQLIIVTNTSASNATSARLVLSEINYKVVNAVGTNGPRSPYVVHAASLGPGEAVELLLEYFIPTRQEGVYPFLTAYSAGTINLTGAPTNGMAISITNKLRAAFGVMTNTNSVIEFPAMRGATYQIVYMTNATGPPLKAIPPIVAHANRVQWIDYGPPKTLSRPTFGATFTTNDVVDPKTMTTNMVVTTNMSMRFYQAFELR